ncbi:peptidase C14, caspase catalytic subunit p20 [Sulfitobacter noctilucae]|uniref:caspase family protein n=1 Tax=Sulfitobacter noctilucae TaxID=1342302 RepID=UPI000467EF48|nr:caspase family protein [Sulfitobacter noctilucae]KIN70290.1 peptidase C14, caspase catalytic subunit p20 [Sulfitobacter noctilucae]
MRLDLLIRCFLVLGLLLPGLAAAQSTGERRVALIIGNSDYEHVTPLDNPGNDATDISVALEGLGFDVFLGLDVTEMETEGLVEGFSKAIQTADVSLFYYAGHGFQVGGQNYLVPTDAQIQKPEDIQDQTIRLNAVLDQMAQAPGIKFVFLDACRNDPFEGVVSAVSEGLAQIGDAQDFLISFATQPDNVAYDGSGRNSYFTKALLGHIYTPGLTINDLMISVRRDVLAATGGRQIPWENSSLTRQFQFDPRPNTMSSETLLWQVAANAGDPQLMKLYAERYPGGAHAQEVMAFLDPAGPGGEALSRDYSPQERDAQEERLWQLARRSRMRPLVQFYLDQYPEGTYAADAGRLIATMPVEDEGGAGPLCERLATHPRDATASTAGVPFGRLQQNALSAIQACQAAATAHPELPHYTALLARATVAAGDTDRAIQLYREAATRGDLRAMVSLGLMTEAGRGVPPSLTEALRLYQRAASLGSADGKINLAVALFEGIGVEKNEDEAIRLLNEAADLGSPIATFNLGVLARDGVTGAPEQALSYFERAIKAGEPRAYMASAILLDEGRIAPRNPVAAANMLLRGAAEDSGQTIEELTQRSDDWSRDTIAAVQERLKAAGFYTSTIDGRSGPNFVAALESWRNGGFEPGVLVE